MQILTFFEEDVSAVIPDIYRKYAPMQSQVIRQSNLSENDNGSLSRTVAKPVGGKDQ